MAAHIKHQLDHRFAFVYTYTGKRFHFLAPKPSEICIEDVAWSLARQSRFYGHTRGLPYSTAQHSILVSYAVPPEHAFAGLMHDAGEFGGGDINRWIKTVLPDYQRLERIIETAVMTKFKVPYPFPPEVKHADCVLAATEMRDLQGRSDWRKQPYKPLAQRITPWPWRKAYREFMRRYEELKVKA